MISGRSGFLFPDKDCLPEVAMHWEQRFNHIFRRYNDIYRVRMPNIPPHVYRHTYCSSQAKAGMNPKTLHYLMGHSDVGVTFSTYTHLGPKDAAAELHRMEEAENARREQEKPAGNTPPSQKMSKTMHPSKQARHSAAAEVPAAECRFYSEKSVMMVYNKLLNLWV